MLERMRTELQEQMSHFHSQSGRLLEMQHALVVPQGLLQQVQQAVGLDWGLQVPEDWAWGKAVVAPRPVPNAVATEYVLH